MYIKAPPEALWVLSYLCFHNFDSGFFWNENSFKWKQFSSHPWRLSKKWHINLNDSSYLFVWHWKKERFFQPHNGLHIIPFYPLDTNFAPQKTVYIEGLGISDGKFLKALIHYEAWLLYLHKEQETHHLRKKTTTNKNPLISVLCSVGHSSATCLILWQQEWCTLKSALPFPVSR